VRLNPDAVVVEYELEVNTATVAQDLAELGEDIDLTKCQTPRDFYEAFVRFHAPVFARNFDASLDGKPLTFACDCDATRWEVREKVSLHCRLVFRSAWHPAPNATHRFTFKEENYEQRSGRVALSLAPADCVRVRDVVAPSAELQAKPLTLLAPGEEDRLREASASFTLPGDPEPPPAPPQPSSAPEEVPPERHESSLWDVRSLEELRFHHGQALGLLMAVAVFLGAAHALTPGHGKTLVAAYLVGERGTVGHALYLGLVTTLSHTGVVLAVAFVVWLCWGGHAPPALQAWLGLGGGLVVACLGAWLLLARLTGRADHVHLPGGHHHHHHGPGHAHGHADHYHDEHGHAHPLPGQPVGWWRLTVLGVTGGIIPCHDAVAVYVSLASAGLLAFALPVLLAFSAGLAGVLVAIGVVVVKARGVVGRRWGESRAFRALPIVSAALVTGLGLWLCYHSLPAVPGR
jgi:ABC-type nickel/cobalt efflux system permease component RcnA